MVFGYDTFNDNRLVKNHQSGSDYRILGTDVDPTRHFGRPGFPGRQHDDDSVQPDPARRAGDRVPGALAVLQRYLARQPAPVAEPRRTLGQEPRREQRGPADFDERNAQPAIGRDVGSEG